MRTLLKFGLVLLGIVGTLHCHSGLFRPGAAHGRATLSEAEAGWRGNFTGLYPEAAPPMTWSATEHVIWKLPLSKWSNATPVLHRDRIFICEEPSTLVCIDRRKAEVLWRASLDYGELNPATEQPSLEALKNHLAELRKKQGEIARSIRDLNRQRQKGPQDASLQQRLAAKQNENRDVANQQRQLQSRIRRAGPPVTHGTNGYSSPTPVAAGTRVFVLFGYGGAAAYDLEGTRLWARMVEKSTHGWGHSASPVLTGGKLIVHINQTVHALDPDTGDELWTSPSASTWGTPLPLLVGGEEAVLTTGGDLIRCRDGAVVSRGIGPMPWTSPIEHEGVIYIVDQNGAFAYKVPEKLEDKTVVPKLWQSKPASDRYYASPVVHEGLLFAVTQRGVFSILDTRDGSVVFTKKLALRGTIYPSITFAGGKLFVSSDQGKTLILEPGRDYLELGSNTLEPFRTSPVFRDKRIYIRTQKNLYCLGED